MSEDRRNDERVATNFPARWDGLSGAHEARVEDFSMGGCFINTAGRNADTRLRGGSEQQETDHSGSRASENTDLPEHGRPVVVDPFSRELAIFIECVHST